jgi:NAD(P)-dependent dehydrogenase (short-subunit alcohol dehydrogenase family)
MSENSPLALVTGAGRATGIGFEVAAQLAAKGYLVLLTARQAPDAEKRAGELQARGLKVEGLGLDVTDALSMSGLVERVQRDHGRLDLLVNNAAGVAPYGESAVTADLRQAHAVLDTTLFGTWGLTQALLPLLRASAHPRVVNVTSGAGSHGDMAFGLTTNNAMGTSYAVAKAAVNALTVKLANELRADRVLVNAVCPGFTATFEGGEQMGARPVRDGAASVVWAAVLPDDGPTGGFFRDGKPLAW